MKTLFFSYQYLNGHGGGVYATRAYANAFAELSERFTLVFPFKYGCSAEHISDKAELIPVSNDKSKVAKYLDILKGNIHRYFGTAESLFNSREYDTVVFNGSMCSFKLIDKAKEAGLRVITIHHNYEVEYFRDNSPVTTLLPMLFWARRFEGDAVRKSDLNLVLTESDKELLHRHYDPERRSDIQVIGVFEYESKPHIVPSSHHFKGKYVVTGDLSAIQTYRSLSKWIDKYYPILSASKGFSSLTIAGKSPSAMLIDKCDGYGIKVIPSPTSMDEIVSAADCYICPVELGGGLKLRIMDGLKQGKPVITHKVSARGYEQAAAKGILFEYDDAGSFLEAVEKVLASDADVHDMADLYRQLYSFDSGMSRLKDILDRKFLQA